MMAAVLHQRTEGTERNAFHGVFANVDDAQKAARQMTPSGTMLDWTGEPEGDRVLWTAYTSDKTYWFIQQVHLQLGGNPDGDAALLRSAAGALHRRFGAAATQDTRKTLRHAAEVAEKNGDVL
jgi:hypothetical protein